MDTCLREHLEQLLLSGLAVQVANIEAAVGGRSGRGHNTALDGDRGNRSDRSSHIVRLS